MSSTDSREGESGTHVSLVPDDPFPPDLPRLETERLFIRPMLPSDGANVQKYAGRREIADLTANIPYPYEDGVAEEWIGTHVTGYRSKQHAVFGLTPAGEEDNVIGVIGFMFHPEFTDIAEIGYWIASEYQGCGLMTEAGRRLLDWGFNVLKLQVIHAKCYARNQGSARVMEKLGMTYEGTLRRRMKKWGKFEDIKQYSILVEEYTSS